MYLLSCHMIALHLCIVYLLSVPDVCTRCVVCAAVHQVSNVMYYHVVCGMYHVPCSLYPVSCIMPDDCTGHVYFALCCLYCVSCIVYHVSCIVYLVFSCQMIFSWQMIRRHCCTGDSCIASRSLTKMNFFKHKYQLEVWQRKMTGTTDSIIEFLLNR